jgi:hypothetical protein
MPFGVHITELQYQILSAIYRSTVQGLTIGGYEIRDNVNEQRKKFNQKPILYTTIYLNLIKLTKLKDFKTHKTVPFIELRRPEGQRTYWVVTDEGISWIKTVEGH